MSDIKTELGVEWREVELPVGPQELPVWLKGLHVDFNMQYDCAPYLRFKVMNFETGFDGEKWQSGAKGRYFREKNGLMEQYWHTGSLNQRADGSWETTQQDGFAGRTFTIEMQDGRMIHLRGPWHGGISDQWNEMVIVETTSKYFRADRAWHKNTGCFGPYVSNEILMKAIARFYPHLRVAAVKFYEYGYLLQPYTQEWGVPKQVIKERIRAEYIAKKAGSA